MNWPAWLTPEKALGIVGALILAVITGTYTVAHQLQQNRVDDRDRVVEARDKEIESLQSTKNWDVPNTIDRLADISKKLQKQFASMEELDSLRKENEALRSERNALVKGNSELTSKVSVLTEQNAALNNDMEKILAPSQKLDLETGTAVELVKNQLALGLSAVYSDGSIIGRLGNEMLSLVVGDSKNARVLGKQCRLTLTHVARSTASFIFFCS